MKRFENVGKFFVYQGGVIQLPIPDTIQGVDEFRMLSADECKQVLVRQSPVEFEFFAQCSNRHLALQVTAIELTLPHSLQVQ